MIQSMKSPELECIKKHVVVKSRKAGLWVCRPLYKQIESTFQKDENAMEVSLPVQQEKEPQNLGKHLGSFHDHDRPAGSVICGLGTQKKRSPRFSQSLRAM